MRPAAPTLAACVIAALGVLGAGAQAGARDWSQGPERLSFDVGVVGLVAVDDRLDVKQLGGVFGGRAQRWGPLTLELMAFGSGGSFGDPLAGDTRPASYTIVGVVPGIGVEFGRGPTTFGVGLFCRPPIIGVHPDVGDAILRSPELERTLFRLPNFALVMGDDRYFIELGGGGDPTPIEPRLGYLTYHWRDADGSGSGGAAGLSALGLVEADGDIAASEIGLAGHLAGWFEIGPGILLGARADVSTIVSVAMTFTYVLHDAARRR